MLNRLRAQPVSRLLILVTVLVAVLPISILGYYIYHSAWQNSWREIREKHQLLAQNIAVPVSTYVNDHHDMLTIMAHMIVIMNHKLGDGSPILLEQGMSNLYGFKSLIELDMQGHVLAYVRGKRDLITMPGLQKFSKEKCYLKTRRDGKWNLSPVKRNPLTGKPTIFMAEPVIDSHGQQLGVLMGELRIDFINDIRKRVRFGKKGHCAIVDATGHIIAHPNPHWMAEIKDISSWPIVKDMMAGKTGVTTFYSPFIHAKMVAGYASVPGIGWGIMVPQPISEVAAQVNELMRSTMIWATIGLILAITLALLLARWITRPLDNLARASRDLMQDGSLSHVNLPEIRSNSPKEIRELAEVLRNLIAGLQRSRDEVRDLNTSLQQRVDEATQKLRDSNEKLELLARRDSLTELANRRYFENSLSQALSRRSGDIAHVCVMLVDIDHFKQINDAYGHAAGDTVLNHVARVLERGMRSEDLVARYGGDEFVAYMRCSNDVGMQRAKEIREAIDNYAIPCQDKNIHITVSIGLYCQILRPGLDVNELLSSADDAMYEAKKRGRNRVVDINH